MWKVYRDRKWQKMEIRCITGDKIHSRIFFHFESFKNAVENVIRRGVHRENLDRFNHRLSELYLVTSWGRVHFGKLTSPLPQIRGCLSNEQDLNPRSCTVNDHPSVTVGTRDDDGGTWWKTHGHAYFESNRFPTFLSHIQVRSHDDRFPHTFVGDGVPLQRC